MPDEMDEIVEEFLLEAREHLDRLDIDLVELEKDGANADTIARVFRSVHTIKGTAGFLDFPRLERIAHAGEDLLGALRDGRTAVSPSGITRLLEMLDVLRAMLDHIEKHRTDDVSVGDLEALAAQLRAEIAGPSAPALSLAPSSTAAVESPPASSSASAPAVLHEARPLEQTTDAKGSPIRVDVGLLDKLMNLVGELVLVRNSILSLADDAKDTKMHAASQRLNLITSELQEGVTHARMQPIGNVWTKVPRLVRDVSRALGKQVELVTEGADTELDKTILEAIADPLTHLIRNAVDHGIELPAQRTSVGKDQTGVIKLRAYHEGGIVTIELSDDGAGIDTQRVGQKAVANGLVSPERLARMSDAEIGDFIFYAGLSTAETVTNVSGRGVGMDVVRSSIADIGGSVEVESRRGLGTKFRVKIPLTLAIIPALVVRQDQDRYAIPQVNLVELVRIEPDQVEGFSTAPVYRLRGRLLPLVYLTDVFRTPRSDGASYVLVLATGATRFGLVVDDVRDTAEIVVKPLTSHLQGVGVFSGATVMGDGRVALILDAVGLASHAMHNEEQTTALDSVVVTSEDSVEMLIASIGSDRRIAIPLAEIERLEVFALEQLEHSAGRDVVQYRGGTLPLHHIAPLLGSDFSLSDEGVFAVVCGEHQQGVIVEQILDVVKVPSASVEPVSHAGTVRARVIAQGRITDVVHLESLIGGM
jgi:two-component system chemotaxis sensor kinase CheA